MNLNLLEFVIWTISSCPYHKKIRKDTENKGIQGGKTSSSNICIEILSYSWDIYHTYESYYDGLKIKCNCQFYVGKLLYINEGHKLSLQYHEEKEETVLVVSGTLEITVGGHGRRGISTLKLSEGETYHVTPGTIHRFAATCGTNVVLAEVSTNYLDDVVRLEDDYDRE